MTGDETENVGRSLRVATTARVRHTRSCTTTFVYLGVCKKLLARVRNFRVYTRGHDVCPTEYPHTLRVRGTCSYCKMLLLRTRPETQFVCSLKASPAQFNKYIGLKYNNRVCKNFETNLGLMRAAYVNRATSIEWVINPSTTRQCN